VVRIQTNAGRDYGHAVVAFDNETKLQSLRGWSIDPKGAPYEVKERDAVETQPFDFELYSDTKVKVLRIPAAAPGSVIAYEYTRRERPFVHQALWHFQETIPVLHARLEFGMPSGWSHEVHWSNYTPVEAKDGVLDLRDIPAIFDEPRMPAADALAGRAAVMFISPNSSTRGWNDVASFFHRLASVRGETTPQMQAKVRELVKPGSQAESIRALARFAQRDVRYVAIEIGIGGYQPHAAGDVFRNRYGDCKDKATLLKTMLKEIGVESYWVLVHTTRGVVDTKLPVVGAFNHVILAVATPDKTHATIEHPSLGKLVLFDPTSTTTPFGYLPSYLQESQGLLVTAAGGELIAMPAHAADANQLHRKATLQLDAAGTLTGTIEETRTGRIAAEMRYELSALNTIDRMRRLESMVGAHLTNYTISSVSIEGLDNPESDLVIRYDLTATNYARRVADMLLLRPRVLGQKPEAIVDVRNRKYGYVTEGPSVQTDDVEIVLAPPLVVDELPPAVNVATPAVQYASASELKEGKLRYKRKYALQTWFVPKERLPELNQAFSKILADERASAVLK
jgi:transglutaminase-like putative cysteine protease